MILTLVKKCKQLVSIALCVLLFLCAQSALTHAQGRGLSLSVTPTLFQMSAVAGQTWSSGVKVINNNPHELTIYAQVVNFAPQGESGEGKFLPVLEKSTEGSTLAEWITVAQESYTIPPEQTVTVPLMVSVPTDAAPGGHFAAILIGTKPPEGEGKIQVSTSQIVTSLFFVRIAGDVTEEGSIREFRTVERFTDTPNADYEVRFENKGNVHLQPQGEIIITNMWGKERGIIPINHQTHFGNVLPGSIRKFEFNWKGEPSFTDIGRYKAVLTLAYGNESKKFETAIAYFYVVPVKATLIFLGALGALIAVVRWSLKAYVRRMLLLSGIDPFEQRAGTRASFVREGDVRVVRRASVSKPLEVGYSDLRKRFSLTSTLLEKCNVLYTFCALYKRFFGALLGVFVLVTTLGIYIFSGQESARDYVVTITNPDTTVELSSEEIIDEQSRTTQVHVAAEQESQAFSLTLINSSHTPGAAAKLRPKLEALGYVVANLESDFGEVKERSVIVYSPALAEVAFDLSKKMGGALLSADSAHEGDPHIHYYIGNDSEMVY